VSEPQELAGLIWSIADALRGSFKASEYGSVLLPFTVLRRLDCLEHADASSSIFGLAHRTSDPAARLSDHLLTVIHGSPSDSARVLELLDLDGTILRLEHAGVLQHVMDDFAALDLGPSAVTAEQMGQLFEQLVRLVMEDFGGESAGEHYSPPDITSLMASLLLNPDREVTSRAATEVRIYDPACGTGGLFSAFESYLRTSQNPAPAHFFGQEINSQVCSIARSLLLLRGADPGAVALGDSLIQDQYAGATFDYLAAVPPFGAGWKSVQAEVTHEADTLGLTGRFGAGLPRVNDSSFLFLQHMIAHMNPVDEVGSRIAIIFSASPLYSGAAGSGESEIRRWILQSDLLEGVIALPDQLFPHTGIPTYLWLLSNRKGAINKDKVIVLNARAYCSTLRKPFGNKRQYISDDQIVEITRLYAQAADGSTNTGSAAPRLLPVDYFGYQHVVIDRPLRLRFAVTDATIAQLEETRTLGRSPAGSALLPVLRSLSGETWPTRVAFEARLSSALTQAGTADDTLTPALRRAVLRAIGIVDSTGELQRDPNGALIPDPDLRSHAKAPLGESIVDFMRREIAPEFPDAWTDTESAQIGYEIRPALFSADQWAVGFGPLARVARQVRPRPVSERTDRGIPLLTAANLGTVETAADLPELESFDRAGRFVAPCMDGDIVGYLANWRVLPSGFGEALTTLTVLRPLRHRGLTLCEWLNTRKSSEYGLNQRISMDIPVPVDAVLDPEFDELLADLYAGRIGLSSTMSKILPNVFRESTTDIEDARRAAQAGASEARLIGELVRPLEDPVWRAEWSYPHHIAGLARQYRIAASPAERKDALLKLGESVARSLGVLALAILIRREGRFTRTMRDRFRNGGGTFGTWNRIIQDLLTNGEVPELRELEGTLGPDLLTPILTIRNEARHEYGVHALHELEGEVAQLEPTVVSALVSVSWLSGLYWNLVERCEYTGSGFRLIGQRLRGSHPEWEPFERLSIEPLTPGRIYVEGPSSAAPISLSPIASVELCPTCQARELFLLKEVAGKVMTLRSSKDHEITRELD